MIFIYFLLGIFGIIVVINIFLFGFDDCLNLFRVYRRNSYFNDFLGFFRKFRFFGEFSLGIFFIGVFLEVIFRFIIIYVVFILFDLLSIGIDDMRIIGIKNKIYGFGFIIFI